MQTFPTLFISHGGPDIVITDTAARHALEGLSDRIGRPKAIVLVSAHFETQGVTVVTDPKPEMIYDFRGFPAELYEMVYPAPGSPELAGRVIALLDAAGLAPTVIGRRGYDHGAWTPLMLAFPGADIPVVQVSIDPDRDAAWHHRLGEALAPLRDDGILLVGSGHITHNLKALFGVIRGGAAPDPELARRIDAFVEWFAERLEAGDREAVLDWKSRAPFPADNHPTDEHLMPIFFALGAAGPASRGERIHHSTSHGMFVSDFYAFH
jgi:4,5-DOPA dioxygenase extradiol